MNKKDVLTYYGTQIKLAEALSISQASISNWGSIIPEKQALRLEKVTGGELKYDALLYLNKRSSNKRKERA